jgi:hypothetical protein
MSTRVCLCPTATLDPSTGAGHLWVYLNWALGLRALGCEVIWLEAVDPGLPAPELAARIADLKHRLEPFGLADSVAVHSETEQSLPTEAVADCLDLQAALTADVLLNQRYRMPPALVQQFRRSALIDIDPGLLQVWMSMGQLPVAPHDVYFTIGETVGQPEARFPDCDIEWHYVPPPVSLDTWTPCIPDATAPFTTVSNWWGDEWLTFEGEMFENNKRVSFLEYADLPLHTPMQLELALCLGTGDADDRLLMENRGWRIRDAAEVSATPSRYQEYIRHSRGEFSCAKPSCVRLANAWISDRTLCYLASGRPAIVQHTGPSRLLLDGAGLFRFRTLQEAVAALATVQAEYDRHCRHARALVETYFDARQVVRSVLERALA